MIATSHAIIGGAAGVTVGALTHNPAAALAAGMVSHLVCDAIPHLDCPPSTKFKDGEFIWDQKLYRFAITDSLIAILATLLIWGFQFHFNFFAVYAWGSFGGYLPDLLDNFPLWNQQIHAWPVLRWFHQFHMWIHGTWQDVWPMPKHWLLGITTQVILVLPCLYYLIR